MFTQIKKHKIIFHFIILLFYYFTILLDHCCEFSSIVFVILIYKIQYLRAGLDPAENFCRWKGGAFHHFPLLLQIPNLPSILFHQSNIGGDRLTLQWHTGRSPLQSLRSYCTPSMAATRGAML